MALCDNFINQTECILELSNIYQLKLITLALLAVFALAMLYLSDSYNPKESIHEHWMHQILSKLPILFLVPLPIFALFMLKHSISYEIFVSMVAIIYLLATALGIGLVLNKGSMKIWEAVGFEDKHAWKESKKYAGTREKWNPGFK